MGEWKGRHMRKYEASELKKNKNKNQHTGIWHFPLSESVHKVIPIKSVHHMLLAYEACVWEREAMPTWVYLCICLCYSPFQGLLLHLSNNSKTTLPGASIQLVIKKQYLSHCDKLESSPWHSGCKKSQLSLVGRILR